MIIPTLKKKYKEEIVPALKKKLNFSSPMEVPRLKAICINQGLGEAKTNSKLLERSLEEMTAIAGQKAVPTSAKQAISNFKLRIGMKVGVRVTLRGNRMYDFLYRLVTLALPRGRDFRGIKSKAFDGQGNYTLGIKEQIIFPEIDIDKVIRFTGMNITFVTDTSNDAHAYALLEAFGLPFKNKNKK